MRKSPHCLGLTLCSQEDWIHRDQLKDLADTLQVKQRPLVTRPDILADSSKSTLSPHTIISPDSLLTSPHFRIPSDFACAECRNWQKLQADATGRAAAAGRAASRRQRNVEEDRGDFMGDDAEEHDHPAGRPGENLPLPHSLSKHPQSILCFDSALKISKCPMHSEGPHSILFADKTVKAASSKQHRQSIH